MTANKAEGATFLRPRQTRWVRLWSKAKDRPEPWEDKAQVVGLRPSRLEPVIVEVAVVMRAPDGGYLHRRVRCAGHDLRGGMPHLLNPDAEALSRGGKPSAPRWVQDQRCVTAEQALEAAGNQYPPAVLGNWKPASRFTGDSFEEEVEPKLLRPEAESLGHRGKLAVMTLRFVVWAVATFAGFAVLTWLGTDLAELESMSAGEAPGIVLVPLAAAIPARWAGRSLANVLGSKNLAAERRRAGLTP